MLRDLHKPSAPMKAALSSCRRHFLSSLIFSALMNVLYIGPVLYMLQIYDRVVTGQGRLTLFFLTVIIIFAIEIGRAHVSTPVTNAHLVCRLLLETKHHTKNST